MSDPFSAGSSLLDTVVSSAEGRRSAKRAMDFAAAQSETQYQRAVKDMELAGLNPALMYGGGAGPAASMGGVASGPAKSDVTSALRTKEEIALLREQQSKVRAETDLIKSGLPGRVMGTEPYAGAKKSIDLMVRGLLDKALPPAPGVGKSNPLPRPNKSEVSPSSAHSARSWKGFKDAVNKNPYRLFSVP